MHADDRKAFDVILGEIFHAIDKPLGEAKQEAFWKGLQRMSIVEFARCRDHIIEGLERGTTPKTFSVGTIWEVKRELRSTGPERNQSQPESAWNGDGWDFTANNRFGRFLNDRMAADPHCWGPPGSSVQADAARIAIAYKRAWASDMREVAIFEPGSSDPLEPTFEQQERAWRDCMARAESEIHALLNGERLPDAA